MGTAVVEKVRLARIGIVVSDESTKKARMEFGNAACQRITSTVRSTEVTTKAKPKSFGRRNAGMETAVVEKVRLARIGIVVSDESTKKAREESGKKIRY